MCKGKDWVIKEIGEYNQRKVNFILNFYKLMILEYAVIMKTILVK